MDRYLYALHGSTGKEKWAFKTGNFIWLSPAIGLDGTVYVCSEDQKVYALNGNSGKLKWAFDTNGDMLGNKMITRDRTICVAVGIGSNANPKGKMYAIECVTGKLKWSLTSNHPLSSPIFDLTGVFYTCAGRKVYAFNGSTGREIWVYVTKRGHITIPAIRANQTIYVGSSTLKKGVVYALNIDTGKERWECHTGSMLVSHPVIMKDGTVCISTEKKVYALNGDTGKVKWAHSSDYINVGAPLGIGPIGTLYNIGSLDQKIQAINGVDGKEKWAFATDGVSDACL